MKITIEYIKWLDAERRKINKIPLDKLEFYESSEDLWANVKLNIDKKIIEDFEYTGMANFDFITSGFYLTGWDEVKGG